MVEFARVDRAAQTPVAERDRGVPERSGDGHGVDLDRAEVVDDRADAGAAAVVQEVVEERGLAGAEESGEHDDGYLRHARLRAGGASVLVCGP